MIRAPTLRSTISRWSRAIRSRRSSTEMGLAPAVIDLRPPGAGAAEAEGGKASAAEPPMAGVRKARRRIGSVPRLEGQEVEGVADRDEEVQRRTLLGRHAP